MSDRLTYALPVREGFVKVNGEERTVWLEHVWNTGRRTRTIVEPDLAQAQITERALPDIRSQQR